MHITSQKPACKIFHFNDLQGRRNFRDPSLKKLIETLSLSGEQIRGLDRLKDCTDSHVFTGSAADEVSYEATPYNRGVNLRIAGRNEKRITAAR